MARTRKNKDTDSTSQNGDTMTTTAPALDLSALIVDDVEEMPTRAATGSGRTDRFPDNPFVDMLRQSHAAGDGKGGRGLTVSAALVKDTTAAIRNAADKLADESIGARIVYRWVSGQDDDGADVLTTTAKLADVPVDGCDVRVMFEGKTRKRYLSDEEKADALAYGFVKADDASKPDSAAYLAWVVAGRPMTLVTDDETSEE